MAVKRLRTIDDTGNFTHPLYDVLLSAPGLSVSVGALDDLLSWGTRNALWVFPMATSCCGIELMATMASRVDLDRMGTIVRATPRHSDVMVVAGTITTKMAPRVLKLWEQMPEPKWCIAMGSCAMSGDFYRELYCVVPGIDTFLPVDIYIPGCPPNPEALMHGLMQLQDKIEQDRRGNVQPVPVDLELTRLTKPSVPRLNDPARNPGLTNAQLDAAENPTDREATAPLELAPLEEAAPPDLPSPEADAVLKAFGVSEPVKEGPGIVAKEQHAGLTRALKGLGYRQLVTIAASHWPAGVARKGKDPASVEHFEVAYILRRPGTESKTVTWSVQVPAGETVPSIANIFAGADWQEREQWDLVGVGFAGHPDLRRLMTPENSTAHPLRRDFASDSPAPPWR